MERRFSTFRSKIPTLLGDLLLEYDFVAFLKVGSALKCTGSLVIDVAIASKLLHAASAAQYAEIESLQYGNSTLELDNSACEYLNSFLDHLESTSLGSLLLECDFVAFLKVGSALKCTGSLVIDVTIASKKTKPHINVLPLPLILRVRPTRLDTTLSDKVASSDPRCPYRLHRTRPKYDRIDRSPASALRLARRKLSRRIGALVWSQFLVFRCCC